jgi:hypothetical protein
VHKFSRKGVCESHTRKHQISSERECVKFQAKEHAKNGEGKSGHEGL